MNAQKPPRRKAKSTLRRIPLSTRVDGARSVSVTGDFSAWSEDGIPLERGADGEWRVVLELAPGDYEYRLRVDGVWQDHAEAAQSLPNPFGGRNGKLTIE